MKRFAVFCGSSLLWLAAMIAYGSPQQTAGRADEYLTWAAKQAEAIGKNMFERGRVGGLFDGRVVSTDRAYNYKLAATWLTPGVIRATARLAQINSRLPEEQTRALVTEAESVGDTVIMVELDPREGSGVIPNDWEAFLQPKGLSTDAVRGVNTPKLREIRALAGVMRRNYDYDRFWVVFPLRTVDGRPLFTESVREGELVVRIYNKEGKVSWPVPDSIRDRTADIQRER